VGLCLHLRRPGIAKGRFVSNRSGIILAIQIYSKEASEVEISGVPRMKQAVLEKRCKPVS